QQARLAETSMHAPKRGDILCIYELSYSLPYSCSCVPSRLSGMRLCMLQRRCLASLYSTQRLLSWVFPCLRLSLRPLPCSQWSLWLRQYSDHSLPESSVFSAGRSVHSSHSYSLGMPGSRFWVSTCHSRVSRHMSNISPRKCDFLPSSCFAW